VSHTRPPFRHPVLPALISLAFFLLMCGLGFWQLDRARQKEARHQQYLANVRIEACPAPTCLAPLAAETSSLGRRVHVPAATWLPPRLLLDNQVHQGRAGYLVIDALDSDPAILVLRAWVAAGTDRGSLPELPDPGAGAPLEAELASPPATGLDLSKGASPEHLAGRVVRLQSLDPAVLESLLGRHTERMVLRELPTAADGPDRPWRTPGSGADRHRAYALQWFTMAAVLALIYGHHRLRGRGGASRRPST
jgi:surfeit locus 1 family protein